MHKILFLFAPFVISTLQAQTLGGQSVFQFLKWPGSPQLSALGGVNVSHLSDDAGMAFQNPALLNSAMHTAWNMSFNDHYAGIKLFQSFLAFHSEKINKNFLIGIQYVNYGETPETDAAGNVIGRFRAADWAFVTGISGRYLTRWNYGLHLKFISSQYGRYAANGIAADAGVLYHDTTNNLSASVLVKNLGWQMKTYQGTDPEDLPFDLQAGITHRLKAAPLSFSLTGQRLHRFDIRYNDTAFYNQNGWPLGNEKKFSFGKLLDHFVIGMTVHLSQKLELQAGYNFLRRRELSIPSASSGWTGFSFGCGLILKKMQFRYAQSYFGRGIPSHQMGIQLKLNEYFGLGSFGKTIGW
ncbi:MAG: type IX secretion system protein PorQ [Chitinophagaceae bacterium]|nr:type IX secretion system protein PorQ [Chitinophagaceae bacterium]